MTTSPEPTAIRFDDYSFWVDLDDGRRLGIPLAWFPRLLHATSARREAGRLSRSGLHWGEIDEDISIAGCWRDGGSDDAAKEPSGVKQAIEYPRRRRATNGKMPGGRRSKPSLHPEGEALGSLQASPREISHHRPTSLEAGQDA